MRTKTKGIRQETNKTWTIDTRISVNGSPVHLKKRGFATLGEAKVAYDTMVMELKEKPSSETKIRKARTKDFEELLLEYRKMRLKAVKITTAEDDDFIYDIYMPEFRNAPITKITDSNVKKWYEKILSEKNISVDRKKRITTRMKDLLLFAFNHKYIDAETYQDCVIEIFPIKGSSEETKKKERVILTEDEERRFFDAIDDAKDLYMFKMFFFLGARIGEFLAIQPKCFDFEKKKLLIEQQYINLKGRKMLTNSLKTKQSYRADRLTDDIIEETKEYISELAIQDDEFLFFGRYKSEPMGRTTFTRKIKKYCEKAGVRVFNPHAARHMNAFKLASECKNTQDIESAAKRLGHSARMFMDTYANHSTDELEDSLIKAL